MAKMEFLTEEELSELSPEEREIIENAWSIKETLDMLPDDISELMAKYHSYIGDVSTDEEVRKLLKLAETDPSFCAQIMAMVDLADINVTLPPATKNPNILALSDEEYKRAEGKLFTSIVNMKPEVRKEFIEVLNNLTPEQEKQMLDELKQ